MARKREWDERKLRKEKDFNREGEGRLLKNGTSEPKPKGRWRQVNKGRKGISKRGNNVRSKYKV